VLVRARVGIYPARGELQLVVEHLEAAGTGALLRAFEALKARLAGEGLFDAAIKRPIPPVPHVIGIITSGTGAALQDILNALARRWPLAQVALYPVPVQGKEAPAAIVRALRELPRLAPADVILLARGGGSIEDLLAFNDEAVARAIRACEVPVISGVGHEIDFSIADFAADLRAATPTAAAELATPDIAEWAARALAARHHLAEALRRQFIERDRGVDRLEARLRNLHPGRRLQERAQRLDELDERLRHAVSLRLQRHREQAGRSIAALAAVDLDERLQRLRDHLEQLRQRLQAGIEAGQRQSLARLDSSSALLRSLNPLAVLDRGYAVASLGDGRIVRDAAQLEPGDALKLRFARGGATTQVRRLSKD
jgi:exodeoxyribonuclease VII large subunit